MSKAGRKIIKGLKEAHAVVKGEMLPTRITAAGTMRTATSLEPMMAFMTRMFDAALQHGRMPVITINFPPVPKPKKEKRAHGRKS